MALPTGGDHRRIYIYPLIVSVSVCGLLKDEIKHRPIAASNIGNADRMMRGYFVGKAK
jgi:hypothetical protein